MCCVALQMQLWKEYFGALYQFTYRKHQKLRLSSKGDRSPGDNSKNSAWRMPNKAVLHLVQDERAVLKPKL